MNFIFSILSALLRQFEDSAGVGQGVGDAVWSWILYVWGLFVWPVSGIGQVIILGFIIAVAAMVYRSWRLNADPLPNRLGDYHVSMPHIGIKGKFRLWPLNTDVDPDIVRSIQSIPVDAKTYDEISMDLKKELEKEAKGIASTAIVPVKRRLEEELEAERREVEIASGAPQMLSTSVRHTLADLFTLNKNPFYLYLARALPTDSNSFGNDTIIFCTNHPVDHSEFYTQHQAAPNYFQGYKTDIREISQSGSDGFYVPRTNKLWRKKKVKFIYYTVKPVEKGSTIKPKDYEMITVFMSMMTQLEVFIDVLKIAKFNERYARELHGALRRGQRWMITLSRRNTDLNHALATESYDSSVAMIQKPQLNPWIAAAVMAGITIVTFEVVKRQTENTTNLTPEAWLMSGIAAGFVGVFIAWLIKRSRRN